MLPDPYRPIARAIPIGEWLKEWFLRRVRSDILRLLQSHAVRNVLDLGCGPGSFSRRLAHAGLVPVALDASPTMLAQARTKTQRAPRFPLVLGDAGHLPLQPVFDAAVLSLALHEMEPALRETVWAEMQRVVRPGGLLVFVDFTLPERTTFYARGILAFFRFDERQIGRIHPPHYANYLDCMAHGDLTAW
ncbi:MAG: class I SAM-dependent methyltransferase, partial [Nitrospirae bacterium]|nr:class I SAM-dependent methyltransferase [Nitrospirota bacterium]